MILYFTFRGVYLEAEKFWLTVCYCEWKGLSHVTSWFEAPVVGGTAWLKETDTWMIINTSGIGKKLLFSPPPRCSCESRKPARVWQSPERYGCGRAAVRRCFRQQTPRETSLFHCFAFLPVTLAQTDPRGHTQKDAGKDICRWMAILQKHGKNSCPDLSSIKEDPADNIGAAGSQKKWTESSQNWTRWDHLTKLSSK